MTPIPVFGFDDLIEGVALSDIIFFIASGLFGEAEVTSALTATTEFFNTLLGQEGLQALTELVNMEFETVSTSEITLDGEIEDLINDDGLLIWEEEIEQTPSITQKITKEEFLDRIGIIANQMKKNGLDLATTRGKDLFKGVVKGALEMSSKGFKKVFDPTTISAGIIGGLGANKLYSNFLNKSNDRDKRKQELLERLRESRQTDETISELPFF